MVMLLHKEINEKNMKLNKLLNIVIVMSVFLFSACSTEEEDPQVSSDLVFHLQIDGERDSRATVDGSWTVGDIIAVQVGTTVKKYIVKDESGKAEGLDKANTFNWEDLGSSSVTVKAWSYGGKDIIDDPSGATITLQEDQSDDTNYYGCDLLYAPEVTVNMDEPAVLTFYHQMTLVRINLRVEDTNITGTPKVLFGGDYGLPEGTAIYSAPANGANPNYGSFAKNEQIETMINITPHQEDWPPQGYDYSYSAFFLPLEQPTLEISVDMNDGNVFYYFWDNANQNPFQVGSRITLNLTIKNKQLSLPSNESMPVTVADWNV
jgi:hypothetical protein